MSPSYKNLRLRLDSGALIGPRERLLGEPGAGAVLVPVEEGFNRGLVTPQQARRLELLLQEMHSRVPGAAPLQSIHIGQKRKEPEPAQDLGAHRQLAHAHSGRRRGEPSLSQGGSSWGAGDWVGKCGDILTAVQQHLGTAAGIFNAPVDTSVYTDYPNHVSQPMDMGTIRQRLDRRDYSNPQEFCSDMRQVWTNCSIYNKKDSVVAKIGSRGDAKFEQLWAASGYDQGGRRRRATGGIAAHKYEPDLEEQPTPRPVRRANSGKSGRTGGGGRRELQPVPSVNREPMPMELMQELASRLQQYAADENMEDIMAIIKEGQPLDPLESENGEVELDFDALEPATLWRLYDFTQNQIGANGNGRARRGTSPLDDSDLSDTDSGGDLD